MFDPPIPHTPDCRAAAEIDESPFQHRKGYPPEAMWELASSIRDVGVKEDCLARPHPHDPSRLELAYGHRRRRASILAVLIAEGLTREDYDRLRTQEPEAWQVRLDEAAPMALVPVIVREMTDEEVVEEQGRENLQRAQPNAMEVALYLDTLMKPRPEGLGYTLDQVLAKTRKERAWVVKHLKLLGLSPKVREALMTREELTEDYGFEIARLASHRLQEAALDAILIENDEQQWDPTEPRVLSLHDARRLIRQRFMLRLVDAPFATDNPNLVEGRGPCGNCPERTGNQQGLFGDVNDDAVCTNVDCYDAKGRAQFDADAQAAEVKVLADTDVRRLFVNGRLGYGMGFVELDAAAPSQLAPNQETWRTVLGTNAPPASWAWVPGRGRVELVASLDVQKIAQPMIRAKETQDAKARAANPIAQKARHQEAEERRRRELHNATNLRAMQAVVGAWPESPGVELLADLARTALRCCWADTLADVVRVLGLEAEQKKNATGGFKRGNEEVLVEHLQGFKKKQEFLGFIACLMYCRGITATYDGQATARLKQLCGRVRVNYGAIERKVRADAGKKRTPKGQTSFSSTRKKPKAAKAGGRAAAKPAAKVKAQKPRRSGRRTGGRSLPAAA